MCSALGMAGAAAGLTLVQGNQNAKFQQGVINRNAQVTQESARRSAAAQNSAIVNQRAERASQAASQGQALDRQVLEGSGLARLGGGSASSAAALQDIVVQESRGRTSLERSLRFFSQQSGREASAVNIQAQNRLEASRQFGAQNNAFLGAAIGFLGSTAVANSFANG